MKKEEVIKWLKIMKANLNTFSEVSSEKKIEALAEAIRLLKNEQSETGSATKNDLGVDCIDRQTAITFVCKNTKEILKDTMPLEVKLSDDYLYENVAKIMRNSKVLPSATPIRPKGKCKWIKYDYRTICPKEHDVDNPYWRIPENRMDALKYCPYCGKEIEVEE